MKNGDIITRAGCVTLLKFLIGQSLPEIERRIGYNSGRLGKGAFMARLCVGQSINPDDIKPLGYSQVAEHHYGEMYAPMANLYGPIALSKMAFGYWQQEGVQNIIKIYPEIPHDDTMDNDFQYPPGKGIPQWKLLRPLTFEVVKFIDVGERLTL